MKTSSFLLSFAGLLTVAVVHGHEHSVSTLPYATQSPPMSYHNGSTVHERFLPPNVVRPVTGYFYDAAVIGEEARKVVNPHRLAETYWAKRLLHKSKIAASKSEPSPGLRPK